MNPFILNDFLEVLGCNMPALIMLVIGMGVTWMNWQRHPRVARWAMLAFVWLLFTDLAAIFWMRVGILLFFPNIGPRDPEEVFSMSILSSFEALGYVFFLLALNAARKP